jgi:hypothetical protein
MNWQLEIVNSFSARNIKALEDVKSKCSTAEVVILPLICLILTMLKSGRKYHYCLWKN